MHRTRSTPARSDAGTGLARCRRTPAAPAPVRAAPAMSTANGHSWSLVSTSLVAARTLTTRTQGLPVRARSRHPVDGRPEPRASRSKMKPHATWRTLSVRWILPRKICVRSGTWSVRGFLSSFIGTCEAPTDTHRERERDIHTNQTHKQTNKLWQHSQAAHILHIQQQNQTPLLSLCHHGRTKT